MTNYTLGSVIGQMLMIGDTNAEWVPCPYWAQYSYDGFSGDNAAGSVCISGRLTTGINLWFMLPMPCTKGNMKLYIPANGLRFYLKEADANDYVDIVYLYGAKSDGTVTELDNDGLNLTSSGLKTPTLDAQDCSDYEQIYVRFNLSRNGAWQFDINFVQIKCYYDV